MELHHFPFDVQPLNIVLRMAKRHDVCLVQSMVSEFPVRYAP